VARCWTSMKKLGSELPFSCAAISRTAYGFL
jgi:hypothetical protein